MIISVFMYIFSYFKVCSNTSFLKSQTDEKKDREASSYKI